MHPRAWGQKCQAKISGYHCTYSPTVFFAPDKPLFHEVNHANGEAGETERNVLIESARIARGKVAPLSDLKASDFAAVVFPGGFGAAKNLREELIR